MGLLAAIAKMSAFAPIDSAFDRTSGFVSKMDDLAATLAFANRAFLHMFIAIVRGSRGRGLLTPVLLCAFAYSDA